MNSLVDAAEWQQSFKEMNDESLIRFEVPWVEENNFQCFGFIAVQIGGITNTGKSFKEGMQLMFDYGVNQEAAQLTTVSTNQLSIANKFITSRRDKKHPPDLTFQNVWRVSKKTFSENNKEKMKQIGADFAEYVQDRKRERLCAAPGKTFSRTTIEEAFAANSGTSMMFGPGTPSIKDISPETTMMLFALKFTQGMASGRKVFKEFLENKCPTALNNEISTKDMATARSSEFFRHYLIAPLGAVIQKVIKKVEMERAILKAIELKCDDELVEILEQTDDRDVINIQEWSFYQKLKRCSTKKAASFDALLGKGSIANSSVRFNFALLHQFVIDFFSGIVGLGMDPQMSINRVLNAGEKDSHNNQNKLKSNTSLRMYLL